MAISQQQDLAAAVPAMAAAGIMAVPEDVLVDVFRRVSPRGLAVSRCVCGAWRALIDDRRLLRADLLPLSLGGLLLCLDVEGELPELFARPGAASAAAATGYLMPLTIYIDDHCAGLVLIDDTVLNPATRRWVRLPPPAVVSDPLPLWVEDRCFYEDRYLAFDPAGDGESPHCYQYQVFCVPGLTHLSRKKKQVDPAYRAISRSEWPPSPLVLAVFSSATGRWEARSLVRQGEAAGTVDDMAPICERQHSACWRGALYVHSHNDLVLRIPLAEHSTTYQVIKPPREMGCGRLGRSEKGVYFASFLESHLCVWILHDDDDGACGGHNMEWRLKHRSAYGLVAPPSSPRSSWTLHNDIRHENGDAEAQEWDSDDETEGSSRIREWRDGRSFRILALHPFREIVFMFIEEHSRGVAYAYHLKSSKLEDLGNMFPKDGTLGTGCSFTWMHNAFPYTPCWVGAPY